MSEFKTIETQEELDNIIKDRLDRNTKKITAEVTKQFEGYISPDDAAKSKKALEDEISKLTAQITEKDTKIADITAKNTAYETAAVKAKIAREYGIPAELADRISGTNEDEYKADAENLAKFVAAGKPTAAPMFSAEPSDNGISAADAARSAAMGNLLSGLMGDN